MYTVAGFNLFGQWFSEDSFFPLFQDVGNYKNFDTNKTKLIGVNWSYNIFQLEGKFFVSGSWRGIENQLAEVKFPEECENVSKNIDDYIVVGNDYNLLLINKRVHIFWILDLEGKEDVKKMKFNVETPININETPLKRFCKNDNITKVALKGHSCLWLTHDGVVYRGILPSCVDTSHCVGEVIDIQCGYEHFVLLTDIGRVYTWGNGRLQLGHDDLSNRDSPMEVEALAGIKIIKVAVGGWHSLALSEFGDLYAWGWNDTGQLGIKEKNKNVHEEKKGLQSYGTPTLVELFDGEIEVNLSIKHIACGTRHSAVLLEDNSVWTTGFNHYGQLGFSEKDILKLSYFKKSFQCHSNCTLMCGPWSTVVIK